MTGHPGTTLYGGGRVVVPEGVLDPGWLEAAAGRVRAVGAGPPPRPADVDLAGRVLLPGLVDLHCHGGAGAAVDTAEGAAAAAGSHLRAGTTTLVASLVTAPLEALARSVEQLDDLVADGLLAGVHLEGPWLSPAYAGAHDPALLRAPDDDALARLLALRPGTIRVVTLAPELPGGLAAVRRVVAAGAVAAVGHSAATYAQTVAAVEAGARLATHLHNAVPPVRAREPGPVTALLEDPRVVVELVVDGVHVHPAVVRATVRAAGPDRVALVTDATAAAGRPDGAYRLGRLAVVATGGVARVAGSGALAGSTLTAAEALRRAVRLCGVPLEDAVRMAASTPARLLGLADRGVLAPGARADLLVLDDELRVVQVVREGRPVPPA